VICDDGNIYTWGRGLYGVLGNGSNQQAMEPLLNDEFEYMFNEAKENGLDLSFKKISAADDYTGALLSDGSFYVWGKNDRGQMGVGSGIGIDLVESENLPKEVNIREAVPEADKPLIVTDFSTGMNTMLVRDNEGHIFKTGQKIDYTPKLVNFNSDRLPSNANVRMSCGRAHYVVLDQDSNNIHCFGKIFKEKAEEEYDGFGNYDCDALFEQGKVEDIQMKYEIFGALVKH